MISGSYSRFRNLKECPRAFWHKNIKKDVKFVPTPQMQRGTDLHKDLEDFLTGKKKTIPSELDFAKAYIDELKTYPKVEAEKEYAFLPDLKLTKWFDKNTWLRIKIDAVAIDGNQALVDDWKTGKINPDSYQLAQYAWAVMETHPQVDVVYTKYVWLDQKKDSSEVYFRPDKDHVFEYIQKDMIELNRRDPNKIDEWEKRESWLCRYCDVPRRLCENSIKE